MAEMTEQDDLLTAVREEIEALHRFISAWFRGETPNTDEAFATGMADRLTSGFVNIQPAGRVLERDDLLDSLRDGHGTNPAFRISISRTRLHHVDAAAGLVLATYVETQSGARHSHPPTNARLSTVLMRRTGTGALEWLHVHETAVPVEQ